jgi:tRNA 2-thiouridine synthesizing protein A
MPHRADRALDARGLLCPLPTVKAALLLEEMSPGQVLEVLADDPTTKRDMPAWCQEAGHRLLELKEEGPAFRLLIVKELLHGSK